MQRRNIDSDQVRRNARADRASPSTASVGSASSASKNTNRAHDTSALTNKLKHLDDCMRQVRSLMKNLEKSDDPMAHQHLQTLQQMMHQLNIEQSNNDARKGRFNALDQRQRHLNEHLESGVHDASPQLPRGLENSLDCDAAAEMQYAQMLEDEKESLMQQNAIIRKILESQKKLSALKEQHDYVTSVQKKAENKLAEAKALQDQLANSNTDLSDWVNQMQRETAAGTLLAPPLSAMRESKRSAPLRRSHQGASIMSSGDISGGDGNWSMSADSAADGASAEALAGATGGHPAGDLGLEQLDRRVQVLQGILAQHGKFGFADPEAAVEECEQEDLQSSQLNENIRALQEQKSHVDQLLSELTALQSEASRLGTQSNLAAGSTNEASKGDTAVRGTAKLATPYEHPSLRDKRRQVNEMRKTLQQLKSAVKNLDQEVASGVVGSSSSDASPATALMGSQQRPRGSAGYKKDNIQGDFPARRHYEAEGRANEEPDVVAGVGAAAAATAAVQQPSDPLSVAPTRTNGDLLADKVRQLQTTRNQLQYLQSLVASFQDGGVDLAGSGPGSGAPSSGEADQRKEQHQRHCLQQQLQEQRLRLSLLSKQLTPSQQAPAKNQLRIAPEGPPQRLLPQPSSPRGAPAEAAALSPAKKDNVTLPKNLYDASKASNRSHDHSSSNLESSGLNRDKAILEELLQQERSKQLLSYSHNEDVRSPSSCSVSSEPIDEPGGSVMAGGTTTIAATWGGSSTQENLEDDEDDDEDKQEGSIEAGHDTDGSHSDGENDAACAMPLPLARKDRQCTVVDAAAAAPGRTNNRLTSMHVPRVNGTYGGGGQWSNWQGTAGYSAAPMQRQQSSTIQGEIVSPDDSGYQCDRFPGGAPGLMMVPGWNQLSQNLIQQLENTNTVYQSILQEQQALATCAAAAVSPSTHLRMPSTDALQHYAIQQQLLLSIIHCYQLLSIQQAEISQLQQATHQGSSPSLEEGLRGPVAALQEPAVGSPFLLAAEPMGGTWVHGVAAPALHTAQTHRPLPAEARGAPPGATLNNQVVPGSRANNFWDNFRSYSRQNLLSNPGAAPKTNELPANFQVQQSQPSCSIPVASTPLTKSWTSSRGSRDYPPSYAAATSTSRSRQMRPVQNVWPQEPTGSRPNDSKQANGAQGLLPVVGLPSDAPTVSSRRPTSRQQQPACDVLKMSIGAEVSRLLEGKEDAASLAAVLHQLQLLNCPRPDLSSGHAVGGARRKVPSSAKSNIPKENRALNSERHLMFQRGTSESSPDLVASVEFATDSRSRIEETLSDSTFDKNTSRPLAAVTARKRAKPLCSPASQPPQLPTVPTSSMERSAPAEHMVAERDCGTNEDQGAAARPIEPVFEQTWPEKDTTVSAPAQDLPQPSGDVPAAEPLQGLDNMLLLAEAHALRGVNQDVQQAMYNFELALLQQGLAAGGEQQGEEAEDDEDRELETEPEAEGTQDLAEADQSPAAEQDAADQQPEDAAPPALGVAGGAEGGAAEQPSDDAASRQAAPQDVPEVPHEEPVPRTESEESPPRQHDGSQPPAS
uniref:Pericentriolar material 1 protein C-terminal domain-containing protein n=1 Tax=Amblyomma aureolatum TaxID=187763 RepID=A0A1E1XC30_9ACAR